MQFTRRRYQFGSLRKVPRKKGPPAWEFRYREHRDGKAYQRQVTLSAAQYSTQTQARRAVAQLLIQLNTEPRPIAAPEFEFGALIDRFIEQEQLLEIRKQNPGETEVEGLQYSTACSYLSMLERHIRTRWGKEPISRVRAATGSRLAERPGYGAQVQGQDQGPDAPPVRKGDALGNDRARTQSHDSGRSAGHQQTAQEAVYFEPRTISRIARPVRRALSNDGDRGSVDRPASQRDSGAQVAGHRFRTPDHASEPESGEWTSQSRQDRVLRRRPATRSRLRHSTTRLDAALPSLARELGVCQSA